MDDSGHGFLLELVGLEELLDSHFNMMFLLTKSREMV